MHPIFLPSEFTSRDRRWIKSIHRLDGGGEKKAGFTTRSAGIEIYVALAACENILQMTIDLVHPARL